jgi:hypothetical protein
MMPESLKRIIEQLFKDFVVPNSESNNFDAEFTANLFESFRRLGRETYGMDANTKSNPQEYLLDITWCNFLYQPALAGGGVDNWPQCLYEVPESTLGMIFGCEVEWGDGSYYILEDYVKLLDVVAPFKLMICNYPDSNDQQLNAIVADAANVTRRHHNLFGEIGLLIFNESGNRCFYYEFSDSEFIRVAEGDLNTKRNKFDLRWLN